MKGAAFVVGGAVGMVMSLAMFILGGMFVMVFVNDAISKNDEKKEGA